MPAFRILSIDGGGVRGAAAASFLAELESNLGQSTHDAFDLIAGTSTGALIALYLRANEATAVDCRDKLYTADNLAVIMDKSIIDKVLPVQHKPKYDGSGKTSAAEQALGDKRLQDVAKKVLVTSYDIINRHIVVFKSWGGENRDRNPRLSEIADASSAAPTFFPTIHTEGGRWLADGGMAANNPSTCALAEAIKLGYKPDEIRLVSIGTGRATRQAKDPDQYGRESQNWGGIGWLANGLIDHLFDGNSTAMEYLSRQMLGDNFIRVNGPLLGASDVMDDTTPENIAALKGIGKGWFDKYGSQVTALLQTAS